MKMNLENHRASNIVMLATVVVCTGMGVNAYLREQDENKNLAVTTDIVKEKVQKELSLRESPSTKCTLYVETDRDKIKCDAISNTCRAQVKCSMECVKTDGGFNQCCGKVEELSPKAACEALRVKGK